MLLPTSSLLPSSTPTLPAPILLSIINCCPPPSTVPPSPLSSSSSIKISSSSSSSTSNNLNRFFKFPFISLIFPIFCNNTLRCPFFIKYKSSNLPPPPLFVLLLLFTPSNLSTELNPSCNNCMEYNFKSSLEREGRWMSSHCWIRCSDFRVVSLLRLEEESLLLLLLLVERCSLVVIRPPPLLLLVLIPL